MRKKMNFHEPTLTDSSITALAIFFGFVLIYLSFSFFIWFISTFWLPIVIIAVISSCFGAWAYISNKPANDNKIIEH